MSRSTDPRVHEIMATVAANLRRFREAAGLTQVQVGQRLGVLGQQIAKWERGEAWIGVGELKLLMDVYRQPMESAVRRTRGSKK